MLPTRGQAVLHLLYQKPGLLGLGVADLKCRERCAAAIEHELRIDEYPVGLVGAGSGPTRRPAGWHRRSCGSLGRGRGAICTTRSGEGPVEEHRANGAGSNAVGLGPPVGSCGWARSRKAPARETDRGLAGCRLGRNNLKRGPSANQKRRQPCSELVLLSGA